MPANKKTIQKQKSFRDFFRGKKQRRLALAIVAVVAIVGAYSLVFAQAAPNNCSPVEGGGICDVNQASSPDGADAVASTTDEVQILTTQHGWTDWGVPFRAPNFPQNGAKPVHRYHRADITAHFLVIDGSVDHQKIAADPANVYEGIAFYGWSDGSQPGTTPIHRINRKPLYFLQMYTDNQNTVNSFVANPDGTWEDGGVNFWAYPAGYFPPQPAGTPTKDTDCANQNLRLGDKGACVQWHKGVMNGYIKYNNGTGAPLDVNNNVFDEQTVNYTKLFAMSLQSKGVKFTNFSGVLTKEIWDAFAAGYPAVPPTPTTPAQPPVVPPKPGPRPKTPAPKPPTKPAPTNPGDTDTPPPVSSPGKSPKEQCLARGGIWDPIADVCKAKRTTPAPNPRDCPDGQSWREREGCVKLNPTHFVYKCAYAWQQKQSFPFSGYDNKATEVKFDNKLRTASEAADFCKTKLNTWKKDNKYFYLYKGFNYEEYQTTDWQHKKVKNIRYTGITK